MTQKSIPFATIIKEPYVKGANGFLFVHSRIKTNYVLKGDDTGKWYTGVIKEILPDNKCSIDYDHGFSIEGSADCVYLVDSNLLNVKPKESKNKSKLRCIFCFPMKIYKV